MKIQTKQKVEVPFEKSLENTAEAEGYDVDELREEVERVMEEEGIEDKNEALNEALRQMQNVTGDLVMITEPRVVNRDEQIDYALFMAYVVENNVDKSFREVRFYPDSDEELADGLALLKNEKYVHTDALLQLTNRDNEPMVSNTLDNQIYGIKRPETTDIAIDGSELEKMRQRYMTVFDFNEDEANLGDFWETDDVDELIDIMRSLETTNVVINSTLHLVIPEEADRSVRVESSGIVDYHGISDVREFTIYFDTVDEAEQFVNEHSPPFRAKVSNRWVITRRVGGEESDEREPIYGRTGGEKLGFKGIEVEDENVTDFLEENSYYIPMYNFHNPDSEDYVEPIVDDEEPADFYSGATIPYLKIDKGFVKSNDTPVLQMTAFDTEAEQPLSVKAYGSTAYEMTDTDDPDDFLEATESMSGVLIKDVKMFGSRNTHEKSENIVSVWVIHGLHKYSEVGEEDLEKFQ